MFFCKILLKYTYQNDIFEFRKILGKNFPQFMNEYDSKFFSNISLKNVNLLIIYFDRITRRTAQLGQGFDDDAMGGLITFTRLLQVAVEALRKPVHSLWLIQSPNSYNIPTDPL